MQNIKTHLVIGATGTDEGRKIKVLYIGPSRAEAREIYLKKKTDKKFDFVGMDTVAGFSSRARPKIDAAHEKSRAVAMATKAEAEVMEKARIAKAAARNAGEAQLAAEAEEKAARKKLRELVKLSGATIEDDEPEEDDAPEPVDADDDDLEGDESEDEEAELAAMIASEEEDEKNADA